MDGALVALMRALLGQAEAGADWVMPGFTHLQVAQPVTWGHHMMAYVEMLGRGPLAVSRCAGADERMPAGGCGAGGDVLSDRPRDDGARAGVRTALRQFARRGQRPRFRAGIPGGREHLRDASEPVGGGIGDLVLGAVPLREDVGPLVHRVVDHAAKAQPGRGRAFAGQDRADFRGERGADDGDEGAAADLFQGHAGGQGTGL